MASHASFTKRLRHSMGALARRLIATVTYGLLGLAIVVIFYLVVTMLLGGAASLNRQLDAGLNIFGSPMYQPEIDSSVMLGMFRSFYPGLVPFAIIMGVVFAGVVIYIIVGILATIGRQVLALTVSLVDAKSSTQATLLTIFVVWVGLIVLLWLVLNVNTTIWFLIVATGLMLMNVLLGFVNLRLNRLEEGRAK